MTAEVGVARAMRRARAARARAIERVHAELLRGGAPRLHMSALVLVTGAAGFVVSVVLLHAGMMAMWLRYPLAVLVAWVVFLVLLRLWLAWQRRVRQLDADELDLPAIDLPATDTSPSSADFGGGRFGGAGAGRSWGAVSGDEPAQAGTVSGALDLDLDDAWVLLVPILLAAVALLAAIVAVWSAPALLAEVLVDGALVAALYRRLKHVEQRHWVRSVIARTWLPISVTALFFAAGGYAIERAVPGAHSLAGVWQQVRGR